VTAEPHNAATNRAEGKEPTLKRGDATALWVFVGAGIAIAGFTLVASTLRIIELLGNNQVPVPAVFTGTIAQAPIGPDGAPIDVRLDRAILTVPSLPVASVGAGILEAVITALATIAVVTLLTVLCRRLMRGQIFSRQNTRIVAAAGITWVGAAALAPFFGNMVANGGFARLSNRTFDNALMSLDLSTLIAGAFAAAFVASVFAVGDRFRRETEGLV